MTVINLQATRTCVQQRMRAMNVERRPPDFINPKDIREMSDEEIDMMLETIRLKRMQSKVLHDETLAVKEAAKRLGIEASITKKLDKLAKCITAVDKAIEKTEAAANEVRSLRMQLGMQSL